MSLSIDDKKEVLEALHQVRAKWRYIGLGLQVEPGNLDAIESEQLDCQGRLDCVVTIWLERGQNCTWTALAEALRNKTVGEGALANALIQGLQPARQDVQPSGDSQPETPDRQNTLPAPPAAKGIHKLKTWPSYDCGTYS